MYLHMVCIYLNMHVDILHVYGSCASTEDTAAQAPPRTSQQDGGPSWIDESALRTKRPLKLLYGHSTSLGLSYPKALRTHILWLLGPKTILCNALRLF